ncbi:MAG: TIGR00269 family protein [Synergistetes bacterium]|nr:TIGR00269 family protein [Synergistota bacterium]MCX8127703.1 TIGR00269 family protein [Synergistota bacterium]MDW8191382.1 TIGR00269 family protein [Synergistota bacterium]
MKLCKICKKKSVVFLKSHRIALCEDHLKSFVEKRVIESIKSYKMINNGEKVLIAVSGGKDSLSLWQILTNIGYEADGMFIDLGIPGFSQESWKKCENLSNKLSRKLFKVNLEEILGMNLLSISKLERRVPCAFCGMIKRYIMNNFALQNGYKVIATGHHLNDECSILLGNILNWQVEYLKRQNPTLEESNGFVRKIKPLVLCSEEEIESYAKIMNIDHVGKGCPLSEGATSHFYKSIINQIEERMPGTKLRFYKGFLKIKNDIFGEEKPAQLKPCIKCGYPTTTEVCSFCRLLDRIKAKSQISKENLQKSEES